MTDLESNSTTNGLTRRQLLAASTSAGALFTVAWLQDDNDHVTVSSPNRNVQVSLRVSDSLPTYSVSKGDRTIIEDSALGLTFKNENLGAESLSIGSVTHNSVQETWQPSWGSQKTVRDNHEEVSVSFTNENGKGVFGVKVRVFDDGIGFRYEVPDTFIKQDMIIEEQTQFELSESYKAWHPTPRGMNLRGPIQLKNLQKATTPVTMRTQENRPQYITIHEAAFFNASAMYLSSVGPNTLGSELSSDIPIEPPYCTPWRVVLLGDCPGDLVESNIILNLNPPSRIDDTSWISPGRATWDWRIRGITVDDFTYRLNTESIKQLVDFAADNGFRYTLIDAGWYGDERDPSADPMKPRSEVNIRHIVEYARSKDVGILLYVNHIALQNYNIDSVLTTYAEWGVSGIKHGFLSGDTYSDVRFVMEMLEKTAEHQLLYNVHEAYKPTGEHRTYPHFLTREFVQSTADGQPQGYALPEYRVVLPFVHTLGGPLDMTPGLFSFGVNKARQNVHGPIQSTIVAQLALCVVVQTGLLHLPDFPEAYENKPELFEFIRDLPPMNWDERRILNGEIGSYVSVARRSDDEWFVGCLTNRDRREIEIPLSFLSNELKYRAIIYTDGEDAHFESNQDAYDLRQETVTADSVINEGIAPGGGLTVKLLPK